MDFEASECTQGRREVTIDWRKVESRKKEKKLLRSQKLSLALFCLRLRRLLSSWIQKWSSNSFLFAPHLVHNNKSSAHVYSSEMFSLPNFTTSAQTVFPLFIYLAPFQAKWITKKNQQSEILNFILYVAQELYQSLFISRWTNSHLLTSANTLALCCCDKKVSFGSIQIPSRNKLSLVWLREIPCGASHLQCRDWNADIFTLTISCVTLVDSSCNRWKFLSSEKLSVVVTNGNHRFTKHWNELLNCSVLKQLNMLAQTRGLISYCNGLSSLRADRSLQFRFWRP